MARSNLWKSQTTLPPTFGLLCDCFFKCLPPNSWNMWGKTWVRVVFVLAVPGMVPARCGVPIEHRLYAEHCPMNCRNPREAWTLLIIFQPPSNPGTDVIHCIFCD